MSKTKNRTPCFVAGCLVTSIIFIVVVVMLSLLFLYIPAAKEFSERMAKDDRLSSVLVEDDGGLDLSPLSEQSRSIYSALQSEYQVANSTTDEGGEKVAGDPFPCNAIVEYYTQADADGKSEMYGMLIYVDSIITAYDVFTTYYSIAGEQGTDFSETDYFLFVRGKAIFVGNIRAFRKAYMNNLF